MSTFEIIAAVLLAVLQCAGFLIFGPRLVTKLAHKLHDILTAAADKKEGPEHDNG